MIARDEAEVAKILYESMRSDDMLQSLSCSLLAVGAAASIRSSDDADNCNSSAGQRYSLL